MNDYISKTQKSSVFYRRAKRVLPEGVSYAIRFFEPYPFYTTRAKGSKLWDVDGNEYVDFWLGHTALILGHSPPEVVKAVKNQLENGTHYGTSHKLEVELAEQVVKMVPSAEMVRFTNSGTEGNMYAIRLARAFTGRKRIVKFAGGWHGGYDALHVGVKYPFNVPESAGLTSEATVNTTVLPFNDPKVIEELDTKSVAAIIVEPMLGAGGVIPAEKGFLGELRDSCDEADILLIFDEIVTGFRLAPGGGQQYYGIQPDISVFGKVLGGGFPIGAFCARREIMEHLDTSIYQRPYYSFHGGTFAANPVTMTAGLATLRLLEDGRLINDLNVKGERIREKLRDIFEAGKIDAKVTGTGSLFNVHFTKEKVKNGEAAYKADRKRLLQYGLALISGGVFVLPTHMGVISTAHSNSDIEKLLTETERYAKQSPRR